MTASEKEGFLKERGWHTWYHKDKWVNPKLVKDPTRQDYTNYWLTIDKAVEWERNGGTSFGMNLLGLAPYLTGAC